MTNKDAIIQRESIRTYSERELASDTIQTIENLIVAPPSPPFSSKIRFSLLDLADLKKEERSTLGTYGFITGARYFIAGIVLLEQSSADSAESANINANAMTDLGFGLEYLILELTKLDLGTCWLGGTFKREQLSSFLQLQENEIITAITPIGYPAERQRLGARLIRFAAGSKDRKDWKDLFYTVSASAADTLTARPLSTAEISDEMKDILESVRLAPSASNKQPWRLVMDGKVLHFFLQRNKGYGRFGNNIDLQRVDMGIAMYHLQAMAEELHLNIGWVENSSSAAETRPAEGSNWEYILSWKSK